MNDQKTFPVRVDTDLLTSFQNACKENDQNASQVVRAFMREYVKKQGGQKDTVKK